MLKVQLEATTRCNSDCVYCPRSKIIREGKRQLADLQIPLLKQVIHQLQPFKSALQVSISGLGEPLLHPNIHDIIRHIRLLGEQVHIRVNTNCQLLKGDVVEKLIGSIDSLTCSLNLATPELYDKFRHGLSYATAMVNIMEFLKLKGNRKPQVRLRINAFDANEPYLYDMERFWKPHLNNNDRISIGGFSNWAGKIKREDFVNRTLPQRKPCHFLHDHLTINLHGDVFPCCVAIAENNESVLCLGNVMSEPITKLQYSLRLEALRAWHEIGVYPSPCDICDSWGATQLK